MVFSLLPKGPSGGIAPPVGPAVRADSGKGDPAATGPEVPAVLTGVCRHLGVDWRQGIELNSMRLGLSMPLSHSNLV